MEYIGYLIDPYTRSIKSVLFEKEDYRSIGRQIDAEMIEPVEINDHNDTLWVDEEALMKDIDKLMFFRFGHHRQPLGGKGIILGCDALGETQLAPWITLAEVRSAVMWLGDAHTVRTFLR